MSGDHDAGKRHPYRYIRKPVGRFGQALLKLRAKFAFIWRFGLISRPRALVWEVDALLGEWSRHD